jgi:uncharacterized damage-inducible protein DinB
MDHRGYFELLARYNIWANQRLITGLAALDDATWHGDQGLFFQSIHGTFNHLLVVERVWTGRITAKPSGITDLAAPQAAERGDLCTQLLAQNEITRSVMTKLPEPLPERVAYRTLDGIPMDMPTEPVLAHIFNHATHHRGQITAAAHRLGLRIQELDIPYFLRDAGL